MGTEIRRAAVLGAGVMGSGIAAHLANAGIPVLLLDIVPPKLTEDDEKKGLTTDDPRFRNRFALAGLEGIKKAKPAALYSKRFLPLIEIGNFEDDWHRSPCATGSSRSSSSASTSSRRSSPASRRCASRAHRVLQHLRPLHRRHDRGPVGGLQAALPGHPLLQPGALHAAARAGGRRGHQARDPRLLRRLRPLPARQGHRLRQGHAQLRRQPDRGLRDRGHPPGHDGDGLPGRRGRRHHRPGHGAPVERVLRHRRPGRHRRAWPTSSTRSTRAAPTTSSATSSRCPTSSSR
jgi:hypothetical protein